MTPATRPPPKPISYSVTAPTAGHSSPLFAILRIPVFVQRPAPATQTHRPSPLVPAAGTQPARVKRVPCHAATAEEIFGIRAIAARPNTPCVRLPPAQRAANTAVARLFVAQLVGSIGRVLRRRGLLEKREEGCERLVSPQRFLFQWHLFLGYTAALCSLTLSEWISRRTALSCW